MTWVPVAEQGGRPSTVGRVCCGQLPASLEAEKRKLVLKGHTLLQMGKFRKASERAVVIVHTLSLWRLSKLKMTNHNLH